MDNIFFNFLKKIDGISFIKPNDEELIKFSEISDMKQVYHVGECPVCRSYGRMEVIYNFRSEKCSVICEECELEFDTADDYINNKNGYRTFFEPGIKPVARIAFPEEIKNSEWYGLVTEKIQEV